ncbi:MAG TPA: pyridoxal phosphate-dependent aminotransferase [Polyangiaceae bacterium]|nr:pyridoxal phosphate-dependent aminotransferase [Polyangiaceae bacterium]HYQ29200.1 pyridoxal phosphate-dependent aminotransferase [Polyangiaceae bacterium]
MTFSRRTEHELEPNALTMAVRSRRAAGLPICDLTQSNPTLTHLPYDRARLLAALSDERSLVYEPASFGLPSARRAVQDLHRAAGFEITSEQIVLTSSTSEAYGFLFKLLCDAGDEVLIPQPSYPLFEHLAALEQVQAASYELAYDGSWHIDFDSLERARGARTRAVVVVNPNNPTGSFLKRDELRRLTELGLPIISDEVFANFALAPDPRRVDSVLETDQALVFALGGLSKLAALPQMKLAWLCAAGPQALLMQALSRLELIADTFLSPNTPVQHALHQILATRSPVERALMARIEHNHALLVRTLAGSAATPLFLEGGWYQVLRLPALLSESEWVLRLLEQDGVLTQPGWFYDFPRGAQLVLSLITEEEPFALGVSRIAERVRRIVG